MPARIRTHVGDLRGAVRLATDATAGLADLVEAVHHRIVRLPGRGATVPAERTRGLTGLVYKSVRGVVRLVGGSVDALLALITPALRDGQPQPEREAVVAALNGVLGDHLAASANPLAIRMTLRDGDHAVVPEREKLAERLPRTTGRVVVMVHGLCMNHLQWTRNGHDHGNALARDLGFTPLRLHYNTGLHISINGAELAQQLEDLVTEWPGRLQRLVLLGHSMGGLVLRSACHQGRLAGHRWPQAVGDLICLGTPHHGAPLERAGHWIDTVLGATPYAAPFARLGKVRSAGITDLRHGHLLAQEGAGRDRVGPRHPKGPARATAGGRALLCRGRHARSRGPHVQGPPARRRSGAAGQRPGPPRGSGACAGLRARSAVDRARGQPPRSAQRCRRLPSPAALAGLTAAWA